MEGGWEQTPTELPFCLSPRQGAVAFWRVDERGVSSVNLSKVLYNSFKVHSYLLDSHILCLSFSPFFGLLTLNMSLCFLVFSGMEVLGFDEDRCLYTGPCPAHVCCFQELSHMVSPPGPWSSIMVWPKGKQQLLLSQVLFCVSGTCRNSGEPLACSGRLSGRTCTTS